jgi:hypothetical protein
MEIKRVEPLSCAKIAGILYAFVGIFIGAIFSLVSVMGSGFGGGMGEGTGGMAAVGAVIGIAAIVVFPICYGVLGFLSALIGAGLYNVLAGVVGGIRIDVQ